MSLPVEPPPAAAPAASASAAISMPTAAAVCPVCGSVQRSASTKHCYLDGRCVDGFDHHCVYLNVCVGRRNYPLFFAFVSTVTALLLLQLFVTAWLLAHWQHADYQQAVETVSRSADCRAEHDKEHH
jgi:hypothetical protein